MKNLLNRVTRLAIRALFASPIPRERRALWTIGLADGSIITSEDCQIESFDPSIVLPNGDGTQTMRDRWLAEIRKRNPSCPEIHTAQKSGQECCRDIERERCARQSGTWTGLCLEGMKTRLHRRLLVMAVRMVLLPLRRSVRILSCLENSLANVKRWHRWGGNARGDGMAGYSYGKHGRQSSPSGCPAASCSPSFCRCSSVVQSWEEQLLDDDSDSSEKQP
jgi:hypothetical protein